MFDQEFPGVKRWPMYRDRRLTGWLVTADDIVAPVYGREQGLPRSSARVRSAPLGLSG